MGDALSGRVKPRCIIRMHYIVFGSLATFQSISINTLLNYTDRLDTLLDKDRQLSTLHMII